MPIFHDIVERPPTRARQSPGIADDGSREQVCGFEMNWPSRRIHTSPNPRTPVSAEEEERPLSRGELIERIKRGTSPTWSFKHGFGRRTPDQNSTRSSPRQSPPVALLPSVELKESPKSPSETDGGFDNQAAGMEIERPRSALHSGDFRDDKHEDKRRHVEAASLATSPVAPWHSDFPSFLAARTPHRRPQTRSRATTHSSLSPFVLMPPTSPLVQATYNSDLDEPSPQHVPHRRSRSPQKENRRHTFSPRSLQAYGGSSLASGPSTPRPVPPTRRESAFPYQAHQPRRSITSLSQLSHSISNSTPHTPLIRPRGLSNASESSPLHHAPMVGSYEESILRGRMSTTPSRPLNFVAQIGVLGRGKCKSSLRCPPHAIVPFPAVFYSYGSGGGRIVDNQPSPYVGLIDIENSIPPPKESRDDSRRRRRYISPAPPSDRDGPLVAHNTPHHTPLETDTLALKRKRERLKQRSQSPKAPPGGSYRIPQQGQLQIIIKNPNKTAVKLFLVPYDLSDMEPGQKTFIRQRSYSAGPIIDMPLSARTNLGTDRPEAALSSSEDPQDRPVLRYLIHLHICCTAKGRYYLYKSIRVVFANRVPDGKERLRNEIQLPEPKYSIYKSSRDSTGFHQNPATFALSSAKSLAEERAARRRSTPANFSAQMSLDAVDGQNWGMPASTSMKAIPFMLNTLETVESRPASRDHSSMEMDNPFVRRLPSPTLVNLDDGTDVSPTNALLPFATRSGRNDPNSAWTERRQNPLLQQQLLLNGESFSTSRSSSPNAVPSKSTEGLLTRQLRGLSVERERRTEEQT